MTLEIDQYVDAVIGDALGGSGGACHCQIDEFVGLSDDPGTLGAAIVGPV